MPDTVRRVLAGLTLTTTLAAGAALTTGTAAADTHWGVVAPTDTQPTDTTPTSPGGTATPQDTHWG